MRRFKFNKERGRRVEAYDSQGATVVHLLRHSEVSAVAIYLQADGVLGMHPAVADQLFLVVAGSGEAITAKKRCRLSPGTAVLWQRGEEHETCAGPQGLTAIVIEGENLSGALAPHLVTS